MPDVTTILSHDHRRVERMFEEFFATKDLGTALAICDELTIHTTVEEEIVYPSLRKADSQLEQEAEKEHAEAKQLIARIRAMSADDTQLTGTMLQLQQAVEHHVEEEERDAWPTLRETFGRRLDDLGAQVEARKQELMGTAATTSGTAVVVAGSGADTGSLLDLTKEELYEKAKEADIPGRSDMNKKQLADALSKQT